MAAAAGCHVERLKRSRQVPPEYDKRIRLITYVRYLCLNLSILAQGSSSRGTLRTTLRTLNTAYGGLGLSVKIKSANRLLRSVAKNHIDTRVCKRIILECINSNAQVAALRLR